VSPKRISEQLKWGVVIVATAFPLPEHREAVIAAFEARSRGFTTNRALSFTRCMKGAIDWS
jgi:hypothetical protein